MLIKNDYKIGEVIQPGLIKIVFFPLLKYLQQFLQEDIEGYLPIHRALVDSSEELTEACGAVSITDGVDKVKDDTKNMVDKWSKINQFYQERRKQVAEARLAVKKYRGLLLPLESEVKRAEKTLERCECQGIDVEKGKKDLQAIQVNCDSFSSFLKLVKLVK